MFGLIWVNPDNIFNVDLLISYICLHVYLLGNICRLVCGNMFVFGNWYFLIFDRLWRLKTVNVFVKMCGVGAYLFVQQSSSGSGEFTSSNWGSFQFFHSSSVATKAQLEGTQWNCWNTWAIPSWKDLAPMNRFKTLLNDSFNGKCQKWVEDRKKENERKKDVEEKRRKQIRKNILII